MITSPSNPEVRAVAALHKRAERQRTGTFLIEGRREVARAAGAGIEVTAVYRLVGSDPMFLPGSPRTIELGKEAFQKLAYGRDGIVATALTPGFRIEDLKILEPALVLVVQSIEKPGNLGAILRSADGAGAALIVTDPVTDLVNPNVIRASLGSLFTVPVAVATTREAIEHLTARAIAIGAAIVGSGRPPWEVDLTGPVAIVVGSEHSGLGPAWSEAARYDITLPLAGDLDSLNASVAAGAILFEAVRQRSIGHRSPS
jgi:RNA methyltransferase, TrmH family